MEGKIKKKYISIKLRKILCFNLKEKLYQEIEGNEEGKGIKKSN